MEPSQSSPVDSVHPSPMDALELTLSMNPGHHGSTLSKPPTMKPSQSSPGYVLDLTLSINPGDHGCTPSSPSSQASPMDLVHSSIIDALQVRETHEIIDQVEQVRSFKRLKSSVWMNPGQHGSTPSKHPTMEPSQSFPEDALDLTLSINSGHHGSTSSSPPIIKPSQRSPVDSVRLPPMDAIESIREMYQKIDPVQQIDRLTSFVENHLQKMNTPSEAGSSSSEGWLETVRDGTKLAAKTIEAISTDKLLTSDAVNAMKGVEYWVFIGLSVAAYAVEKYLSVASNNECRKLLLNILELAKDVREYSKRMSDEEEMLRNAVGTIVDGTVIFCDDLNLKRGNLSRFLSATTAAAELEKNNEPLRDARDSLHLSSLHQYWDKDVFLSHSGQQKKFVRKLHKKLTNLYVSCFFDEYRNSLPLAEKFPSLMFKAAEKCKIAVVVLSKKFIDSKWPMIELSAFIGAKKSGKNAKLKLIPIFFKISPNELSGITKEKPEWQNLRVDNARRLEWEDALKEVRSINGLNFSEDGDEEDCRDEVVKAICGLLPKPPQLLDFEPVGIEEQVLEVKALLDMEGACSVSAVMVYGFGGIGKSTFAASVIQSLDWSSTDLKFCSVDVDEKPQDKTFHIVKLQKHIIQTLGGDNSDFQNLAVGRCKIRETLKKKWCLLFVDNVVDKLYPSSLTTKFARNKAEDNHNISR